MAGYRLNPFRVRLVALSEIEERKPVNLRDAMPAEWPAGVLDGPISPCVTSLRRDVTLLAAERPDRERVGAILVTPFSLRVHIFWAAGRKRFLLCGR